MSYKDMNPLERSTERKDLLKKTYDELGGTLQKIASLTHIEADIGKDGRSKIYEIIKGSASRIIKLVDVLEEIDQNQID